MALRCSNCGFAFNSDGASVCSVCRSALGGSSGPGNNPRTERRISGPAGHSARQLPGNSSFQSGQGTQGHSTSPNRQQAQSSTDRVLSGRISQVERNEEQPSQDIFSILSKIMIGIMIVVPFIALFFLTGAMSFAFAILGLRTLSHLFNPIIWATSLFEFFEIMVLARIRGTDLVPIYRGSVQDSNGQETFFYFRGPLQHGNLVQGNRVEFRGRDNNGTFVVSQGRDLTTNALISSTYRNPWRVIFYVLICIYIGLLGVMYAASWPHVQ